MNKGYTIEKVRLKMCAACLNPEAEIKKQIESARSKMNRLADELGHNHPEVMHWSKLLDELLLQYYAIKRCFKEA